MRLNSHCTIRWRNQADVREAEFSPVVLPGNLKDNVSACPLGLVFDQVNLAIQDMPNDLIARHEFRDLLRAEVNVARLELKLSTYRRRENNSDRR